MNITEVGALLDKHPRCKNKALLLDITTINPCASSNLENAARHTRKYLADAVEQKKNKYLGSFPATYSLLLLVMSTCGEVDSEMHTLIKELTIRRVEQRSETNSNESQHPAGGTEVVLFGGDSRLLYSRHFHSARIVISAHREWCLRALDNSVRKALCLYTRIIPSW